MRRRVFFMKTLRFSKTIYFSIFAQLSLFSHMKKIVYIISGVLLAVILSTLAYVYLQRNAIVAQIVSNKITALEKKKNLRISYGELNVQNLNGVCVSDIVIIPCQPDSLPQDTLSSVASVCAEISLWELLKGNMEVQKLHINNLRVWLTDNGVSRNIDPLLPKEEKTNEAAETEKEAKSKGFSERFSDMLTTFFRLIPEDFEVTDICIKAKSPSYQATLTTPEIKIDNNQFSSNLLFSEDSITQNFTLEGKFRNADKSIFCKIYAPGKEKVQLPYIKYKYDMTVAFDTAQFDFKALEDDSEKIQLGGNLAVKNLLTNHWRISEKELLFEDIAIDYVLNAQSNYIELDSSSVVHFNKLQFNPYLKLQNQPSWVVAASLHKSGFPADDLFSSIPQGMFANLEGIKTSGSLDYHFDLNIDFDNVDSLTFRSNMEKHDFKIEKMGATDFRMIQSPFTYHAYENGELVRSFVVGESNPNFRSLNQISECLRGAVMFSEDGQFFRHKGFYENAIKASLIQNLKEKRFARGGSTISMQLVKNVFLCRNKTMMRKLEEILIVWLIENNRLVSKERMYETYLNIIEWGPNVYGAEEAAQFYFDKSCDKLSPAEAIFMASIVPRPKKFKLSFNEDGTLKEHLSKYYEKIGYQLHKNSYISDGEFRRLKPEVELKGNAKNYFSDLSEKEEKPSAFKNFFNLFKKKKRR